MSKNNNNYVNMLSSYGFGEQDYFETYPEERRNWRKAIRKHMDEEFTDTRKHESEITGVTDEEKAEGINLTTKLNTAETNINNNIDAAETSINNNIDAAEASINNNIDDAETSINNNINELKQHVGWDAQQNKTVVARLKEIYTDTQRLISKFPNNTYYNL